MSKCHFFYGSLLGNRCSFIGVKAAYTRVILLLLTSPHTASADHRSPFGTLWRQFFVTRPDARRLSRRLSTGCLTDGIQGRLKSVSYGLTARIRMRDLASTALFYGTPNKSRRGRSRNFASRIRMPVLPHILLLSFCSLFR